MRLIRIKLQPDMVELLGETAQQHSIEDRGFAEDLFCLVRLKGGGLPADDRLEKMADVIAKKFRQPRPLVMLNLRKRRHVLTEVSQLTYFKALCLELAAKPHEAVHRIFQTFRETTRKVRQAQCLTCALRSKCAFGQQYGEAVSDISRVVDPDYTKKVHDECPERPQIDAINQMSQFAQQLSAMTPVNLGHTSQQQIAEFEKALEEMQKKVQEDGELADPDQDASDDSLDPEEMAEEDPSLAVGGKGRGKGVYSATSTGAHYARVSESLVKQMTAAKMVLFEIGRQLQQMLSKATKNKFKPAPSVADKSDIKSIRSTTEVTSVAPAQQALDDDVFNARMAKKSLQVTKYEEPEDKKFLLYCLIDVSGSMNAAIGGNSGGWALVTRGQVAATLSTALLQRVRDEEGMAFLRFFDDAPGYLVSARTKPQFEPMIKEIAVNDFNGGGTKIDSAVLQALKDIGAAKDEIRKAEVLLITDGDDTIDTREEQEITDLMKKHSIRLNTLNINPSGHCYGNAAAVLKNLSTKYLKVNPATINVDQFVELVT